MAVAVTGVQARKRGNSQPLKVKEMTSKMVVDKEELVRLQEEDSMLQKFKGAKETKTRKGYRISYEKRGRTWYRIRQRKDEVGDTRKHILVPKPLREKVMEVTHDSLFGRHMRVRKTENGILTYFFWPGLHEDVANFCQSCDVCQKTVPKGSLPRAPSGDMPLIDQHFKKIAIDLVGPIVPASDKRHRNILTLVDYVTRYPEAVLLKNVDTETVAKALLDLYSL